MKKMTLSILALLVSGGALADGGPLTKTQFASISAMATQLWGAPKGLITQLKGIDFLAANHPCVVRIDRTHARKIEVSVKQFNFIVDHSREVASAYIVNPTISVSDFSDSSGNSTAFKVDPGHSDNELVFSIFDSSQKSRIESCVVQVDPSNGVKHATIFN